MARNPLKRKDAADAQVSEQDPLRERLRALQKERRAILRERDAYRDALMAHWKKEGQMEDWSDFDPADYQSTLADILAEFEKEEGACLPPSTKSSTRARSRKSSKTSFVRRNKPAS